MRQMARMSRTTWAAGGFLSGTVHRYKIFATGNKCSIEDVEGLTILVSNKQPLQTLHT